MYRNSNLNKRTQLGFPEPGIASCLRAIRRVNGHPDSVKVIQSSRSLEWLYLFDRISLIPLFNINYLNYWLGKLRPPDEEEICPKGSTYY